MDANIIPKVTVIVATHNRPDYLFRCLLAIKLQTFKEFECIVVGDNCNYSENVFKEFADDKRFVYFKTAIIEENLGAISKNLGINKANLENALTPELYATDEVLKLVKGGKSFRESYQEVKEKYA